MLREVAEVYTSNLATGHPTKAVREAFDVAQSTAQLYVRKARDDGWLTTSAPDRKGSRT